jgi:methylsterol monooxygenase
MFSCFWLGSAFFTFCDVMAPSFVYQYKIQETKNFPVDRKKLVKVVMVVLLNQILCAPYLWAFYQAMKWRGCTFKDELPTFHWFLVEFIAYLLVEEIGFYYFHR